MPASRRPPVPRKRPVSLAPLRAFESAGRHLSFTLAGAELSLTQSSISRQVAALEGQVGKALFVRRTRALEFTAAGEQLHRTVQRMLAEIDRQVDALRGATAAPRVTVATYASFASLWLVPRLGEFQASHRDIEIRVHAADRMVDLEAEDVDLAIRLVGPGPAPAGAELLHAERCNAAVAPRLLADLGKPIDKPAKLGALPLLELDDSVPGAPAFSWRRWCEHAGVAPFRGAGRLYFTYTDQLVQAALRGQGAAIVRTPFLDDLVARGDVVVPFPSLVRNTGYRYFLLTNRRRTDVLHVQAFKAWLLTTFRGGAASTP